MRKCHSILCFLFSPPVYKCIQLQYQQGLDEFKEKKMEIGIQEQKSGFAWVMGNRGSPGILDLLYPGLESHGIYKSVGHGEPWKIE